MPEAFAHVSSYLSFKEYQHLASLSRAFHEPLREQAGARALSLFIKARYVDQQPSYTVTHLKPAKAARGGGPISARFADSDASESSELNSSMAASEAVALADIKRLQQNDRLKYAMQRYVTEAAKAGAQSERAYLKS